MLQAAKNQFRVTMKTLKYGIMREMLNKTSFFMNVIFMMLNNATFVIQWVLLFSLKKDVGGYDFNQILLLWGMAAGTYGVAHLFFKRAFSLSELITCGKLDSFLVQPKNVLISAITSEVEISGIGDILYGYIVIFISGITPLKFILYTLFIITGGIAIVDLAIVGGSLSFWFGRSDMIAGTANDLVCNFATYPDGIFKGAAKFILLSVLPLGIANYIPVWVLKEFNLKYLIIILIATAVSTAIAFLVFYRGLRRYASSNLMVAKI